MSKYRNKFCQSSSPGKGPSADQIWNASQKVGTPAYKYARAICEKVLNIHDLAEIDERIYMAAPKSKDSINRKARNNYNGDRTRIKDGARLTLFTKSADETEKIIKTFTGGYTQNKFIKDMQRRSDYRFHEEPKDFISSPKRWGYMATYLVLEHKQTTFEIQIYPECMKPVYDITHKLYDSVRGSLEKWEQSGKNIDDVLSKDELNILQEMLDLHKSAAKEAGILKLVNRFPKLGDLPSLVREFNITPYPQDEERPAPDHSLNIHAPVYDS
tara:strand:+ start:6878 stop:7690 length:813 start_codon:yes stop_codon:yes gene_type:complete